MDTFLILSLCFIPLVAVTLCFVFLVPGFKIRNGLLSWALGLVSIVPIVLIQFFIKGFPESNSLPMYLLQALVLNGLVEESFKMLILFLLPARNMKQNEFFSCAILSGLALACFENMIYLLSGFENIGLRILTAVVIHLCCSGLSGLFVYGIKKKYFNILPFIFAIFAHGIYNYFASMYKVSWFFYFSFAVILIAIIECRVRYINTAAAIKKNSMLSPLADRETIAPEDIKQPKENISADKTIASTPTNSDKTITAGVIVQVQEDSAIFYANMGDKKEEATAEEKEPAKRKASGAKKTSSSSTKTVAAKTSAVKKTSAAAKTTATKTAAAKKSSVAAKTTAGTAKTAASKTTVKKESATKAAPKTAAKSAASKKTASSASANASSASAKAAAKKTAEKTTKTVKKTQKTTKNSTK